VSMVAALSVAMTGCGASDPDWTKVCVDSGTGRRVVDADCDSGGGGAHGWRYYGSGSYVPGVGESASGGSASVPRGSSVGRGAAVRGGFGGHGSGHGSVGG